MELLVEVEELHQRVDRLEGLLRSAALKFGMQGRTLNYDSVLTG